MSITPNGYNYTSGSNPSNLVDLPFQPPFDFELPDYKEIGKSLRQLAISGHCFETFVLPEPEMPVSELESVNWNMMPLAPLGKSD